MNVGDGIGTLQSGAVGDATILRIDDGAFTLTDAPRVSLTADRRISHVKTVKGGRVYKPWLR